MRRNGIMFENPVTFYHLDKFDGETTYCFFDLFILIKNNFSTKWAFTTNYLQQINVLTIYIWGNGNISYYITVLKQNHYINKLFEFGRIIILEGVG